MPREKTETAIKINNLNKVFILPHERASSIKNIFINFYGHKRSFERQKALDNISFEIKKGEFFGIIGRNGSGKSTLLKILAGIYSPTTGSVEINGSLTPFIELGVGFNAELTGRENVFLNGALLGFSRKEMQKMYKDIVDFAELANFMDQKLKNYSSGMQVRLAFSIAIRAESDILLIDEVLAVGDLAFQEKCYKVFEEIKKSGKTVVFISHDGAAVERFCDRAAILNNGELIAVGQPKDLLLEYGALVANQQYEIRQSSIGELQHQGNGAITIKRVRLVNKKGQTQPSINFGDPLRIEVVYKLNRKLDGLTVVGIGLADEEGNSIMGPNTSETKQKAIKITGSGKVMVEFNSTPLSPSTYTITAGFYNTASTIALDLVEKAAQFKIIGETRHGKIYIEPKWSVTQDPR